MDYSGRAREDYGFRDNHGDKEIKIYIFARFFNGHT